MVGHARLIGSRGLTKGSKGLLAIGEKLLLVHRHSLLRGLIFKDIADQHKVAILVGLLFLPRFCFIRGFFGLFRRRFTIIRGPRTRTRRRGTS